MPAGDDENAASAISLSPDGSGYYGHLNVEQQRALDELKGLLTKDGLTLATLEDEAQGSRTHGVSDLELLRFLRARRFDVAKTYSMYSATLQWRKSIDIDNLYKTFNWEKAQMAATVGYRQYFHREDRSGSPIHIHELGTLDLTRLFKVISPEDQITYMFLLNESNFRERFPGCTNHLRQQKRILRDSDLTAADSGEGENESEREAREIREVETVTGILDVRSVGLMSFWKIKDILGQVIRISDMNYPETSNRLYIINAPSMFSTIWGYVKGWIDARTASRVFILGSDYKATLLQHVAPENLPTYLGGTCTCKGIEGGCRNGDVGVWNPTGAPWAKRAALSTTASPASKGKVSKIAAS